jgi:hypothetical protein
MLRPPIAQRGLVRKEQRCETGAKRFEQLGQLVRRCGCFGGTKLFNSNEWGD